MTTQYYLINTCGNPFETAEELLEDLVDLVGADHIMVGSDYCFDIAYEEPVRMITQMKGISDEEKQMILGENAKRLLRLE